MIGIETRRYVGDWAETTRNLALREAITQTAALGFIFGGFVRMLLGGAMDLQVVLVYAVCLPLGAVAAAVLAGILVNLVALPALSRVMPGRGLPDAAYLDAGALSGLAAFTGAFADFLHGTV